MEFTTTNTLGAFRRRRSARVVHVAALASSVCSSGLLVGTASAVNTISFSTADAGITKSVAEWGVDAAWPSPDNVRLSLANMGGASNTAFTRICWDVSQPLINNGNGTYSLNATSKAFVDNYLSVASQMGIGKALTLVNGATSDAVDPSYSTNNLINPTNYARLIKTTQEYINSRPGWTNTPIKAIEVFNEPDFGAWQGNATPSVGGPLLSSIIAQLKTYSVFQNTQFQAPSVLNSDTAQAWYNYVPNADSGTSHLLAGSLTTWTQFIDNVRAGGKPFANLEIHSLGEMIAGAEHGMSMGSVWGESGRARGGFMQASAGKRLGYAEDLARQSASAVYRTRDGKIRVFAGGLERYYTGSPAAHRFIATDRDVYFNGIPTREFVMQAGPDDSDGTFYRKYGFGQLEGSMADVDLASSALQPFDGYRFKIVNAQTGQVMEVAGSGTNDGDLIRSAADVGGANQRWNIIRSGNGQYQLYNANSGKTAEIAGGSLDIGASARQWGTADNNTQQWNIETVGNGNLLLRNGNSFRYLNSSATNSTQGDLTRAGAQQWKLVLDNPTSGPKARYQFASNTTDSGNTPGTYNATAVGGVTYVAGPSAGSTAVKLNGTNSYVQLPSGVATTKDMTVSMAVKWDGGNAWQRIFDFGNNTTQNMFLTPRDGDGLMRFALSTGGSGNEEQLVTSALPIGQWVNLTLALGGNTAILYVNGKPQVAGNIFLDPSDIAGTLNYLGKSQYNDPLFAGSIADFKLFDYALTQTQVMDLTTRPLTWVGSAGGGVWNTSTANFKLASGAAAGFVYGDTVTFDGTGASTVTLAADVSPRTVSVTSAANTTFTGSGSIIGPSNLVKFGAGTLIIANTGANYFAGGTTISEGAIQIGNGGADGSVGIGDIVNNATMAFNRSNTITQGTEFGAISGTGAVKIMGGTVVMTATNSYTGTTIINAGGTLQLDDGSITSSASVVNNGSLVYNNSGADTFTYANVISGTGAVVKNGVGTQMLSGNNAFSGGATVNAGTLVAGSASALGSGMLKLHGGAFGTSATLTIANAIEVTGANTIGHTSQPGDLTLSGALTGSGTLRNFVGTSIGTNLLFTGNLSGFTGTMDYTGRSGNDTQWWRFGTNGVTVDLSNASVNLNIGNVTNGNAFSKNFGFKDGIANATLKIGALSGDGIFQASYNNSGPNTLEVGKLNTDTTFSGVLAGGNAGTNLRLTKVGSGKLTLTGANLHTNTTTISSGTLQLGSGGTAGSLSSSSAIINNATLAFNRSDTLTQGTHFANGIGGTGGVLQLGSGTTVLNGVNTYTGDTTVSAGTLRVATGASLASATNLTANGGTARFSNANQTITSLAGTTSGVLTVDTGSILTVSGAANFSGVVNANGTLRFSGNGGGTPVTRNVGTLNVGSAATVQLSPSVAPLTPLTLQIGSAVTFANSTSKIDLTNNILITAGSVSSARALIIAGNAITTTSGLALGYGDAGGGALYEIRATLLGDTNLDGTVDVTDLGNLASSYGANSGAVWVQGDTNYDSKVDVTDLGNMASSYGGSLAGGPLAGGLLAGGSSLDRAASLALVNDANSAVVPEPQLLPLIGIIALALSALPHAQRRLVDRVEVKAVGMIGVGSL